MQERCLASTMLLHAHVVCSLSLAMERAQIKEEQTIVLEVLHQTA